MWKVCAFTWPAVANVVCLPSSCEKWKWSTRRRRRRPRPPAPSLAWMDKINRKSVRVCVSVRKLCCVIAYTYFMSWVHCKSFKKKKPTANITTQLPSAAVTTITIAPRTQFHHNFNYSGWITSIQCTYARVYSMNNFYFSKILYSECCFFLNIYILISSSNTYNFLFMFLFVSVLVLAFCIINILSFEFPLPFHPLKLKRTPHQTCCWASRTTQIFVLRHFVWHSRDESIYALWDSLLDDVFIMTIEKNEVKMFS